MNDFLRNMTRYPSFFFSSVTGLIFVILTPIRNLFKVPRFRILLVSFILLIIILVGITLKSMSGL